MSATLRSRLATAHAVAVGLLVALIMVQAILVAQTQLGVVSIEVHGYVGNVSFAVGFVVAVLAAAARLPGTLFFMSAILLALLFAQTGLGYVGRTVPEAAAWHVPLGVGILGLGTATLAVALMRLATQRASQRASQRAGGRPVRA
ncbi:MAG: hypothetical protein JJU45_09700 [Acidimicrobiia bacterium]|nr:hypothetical protein [Acidimicrobiia bacterium]